MSIRKQSDFHSGYNLFPSTRVLIKKVGMMRILLGFTVSLLILSACEDKVAIEPAFIRIVNDSRVTFDYVSFYGVPEDQAFGALAPGDTSTYRHPPGNSAFPGLLIRVGEDTLSSIYTIIDIAPPPALSARVLYLQGRTQRGRYHWSLGVPIIFPEQLCYCYCRPGLIQDLLQYP